MKPPLPTARLFPWLLAAPAVVLLLVGFLGPLVLLVRVSLFESGGGVDFYRPGTWSTRAYADLLGSAFGRGVIGFTVALGVGVATLAVLLGYLLALYIHSLPRRAKRLALGVVILPKLANVFVVLYGVNLLLGNSGPVNGVLLWLGAIAEPLQLTHNLAGVLIAETYLILPYAVIVLVPALDRIDPTLVAAARGLGAGPWTAFRRVTLPLSLPGVVVAGQLCLIWALGAFVGPILLGGPEQATLSVVVQRDAQEYSDWPRAAAAAVLSLVTVGVCVAVYAVPARVLLPSLLAGEGGGAKPDCAAGAASKQTPGEGLAFTRVVASPLTRPRRLGHPLPNGERGRSAACAAISRLASLAFRLLLRGGRLLAAGVLVAMLAPFAYAVWMSFAPGEVLDPPMGEWSLRWYREFLGSAKWTRALETSAEVALLSVVGSLVGGLGLAVAVTRFYFRGRRVLSVAVLLPLFVPAVVLAMGLLPLVLRAGVQGMTLSLAAAHSLVSLPVVFLLLRSALVQTDADLERAARGLGAGPWTAFRRVTLPLIAPSLFAGAVIAFILSVNEFVLSLFLSTPQVRTLPATLWPEARYKETPVLAAASCLTVLATAAGMALAARLWRK